MTKLPLSLFLLPEENSAERKNLEDFLDYQSHEISIFMPWLSSEILVFSGAKSFLNIIEKEGSKRISISKLNKYIELNDRLIRIINQNINYSDTVDIQSVSGFIECLKKYCVASLIERKKTLNEIVGCTGVSIRTIQRINSKTRSQHSQNSF